MFEHKKAPLLPLPLFYRRVAKSLGFAAAIIGVALLIGTFGYHFVAKFSWIDAFLNACMILTGMGPVGEIKTSIGKIFASLYALFSGVIFLTVMSVTLAPIFHRVMHQFHLAEERDEENDDE